MELLCKDDSEVRESWDDQEAVKARVGTYALDCVCEGLDLVRRVCGRLVAKQAVQLLQLGASEAWSFCGDVSALESVCIGEMNKWVADYFLR